VGRVEVIRSFICVDVADEVRSALTREHRQFNRQAKEYRWVDPENYHLTIKFLGNVSAMKIPDIADGIREATASLEPFEVNIFGFDAFPYKSNPRVVWAGVNEGSEELMELWESIDTKLVQLGFPPEQREFTPHLTLGRVKSGNKRADLMPLFSRLENRDWGHYTVDAVKVMKSELKRRGPEYTVLEKIDLNS
jgi:2'-5' RNA ligase